MLVLPPFIIRVRLLSKLILTRNTANTNLALCYRNLVNVNISCSIDAETSTARTNPELVNKVPQMCAGSDAECINTTR